MRELRADRDRAYGMLKVIAALQVVIIGMFIAVFTWGLNHMTFHSDYERRRAFWIIIASELRNINRLSSRGR